jgi:hypothetical protein
MIVFNFDTLEQFLETLPRRIEDEVFLQYIEQKSTENASRAGNDTLIMQFLGKINVNLIVLHQCMVQITKKEYKEKVIESLKAAFAAAGGIRMISGKIHEIIMSIA